MKTVLRTTSAAEPFLAHLCPSQTIQRKGLTPCLRDSQILIQLQYDVKDLRFPLKFFLSNSYTYLSLAKDKYSQTKEINWVHSPLHERSNNVNLPWTT